MRRKVVVGVLLGLLVVVGSAGAVRTVERVELRAGDLLIVGQGGFTPEKLPRFRNAPIKVHIGGTISTLSGAIPPVLNDITFEYDRQGAVDTVGLPVCAKGKLVATDVPAARRACGDAIVGKGYGTTVVALPEQRPLTSSTGITLFNGPRKNGFATVLVHAHIDVPAPSTVLFQVVIEEINKGVYGYRTDAKIPKLVNGYGHPVSGFIKIGREWTYKGKRHSYVSARCENGRLQARGKFGFVDGTLLSGTFFRPCKVLK